MISKFIRLLLHFVPLHNAWTDQLHFLSVRNSMFSSSAGDSSVSSAGGVVAQLMTNSPSDAFNSYGGNFDDGGAKRVDNIQHPNGSPTDQKNNKIIPDSIPITSESHRNLPTDQIKSSAESSASIEVFEEINPIPASTAIVREPAWLRSGKFQGDIDGVDENLLRQLQNPAIQFNALRNRQLIWPKGVVPYELDMAFSLSEARLLQRVFRTYRRRTFGCIRFRPRRNGEMDYLSIVKGNGCYSQVGKTGGKQELSLGRGCLFNETITHELMHSLGFWHEHSRADRDEHIVIRWENILPGMDSQFDIVSSAIQDTLGEPYDYRSIMHYGSSAFSRNGRNTLEAVADEFTNVIGTAMELSEMDVSKIMKLYRCKLRHESISRTSGGMFGSARRFSPWRKRKMTSSGPSTVGDRHQLDNHNNQLPLTSSSSTNRPPALPFVEGAGEDGGTETAPVPPGDEEAEGEENAKELGGAGPPRGEFLVTTTRRAIVEKETRESEEQTVGHLSHRRTGGGGRCRDHFLDCPQFRDYCKRVSFYFIMRSYCPRTCGRCGGNATETRGAEDEAEKTERAEEKRRR
ncbi:hypothetical protein niasHT_030781 [Heterodera trifolii]|uniref:Metalloendopeptidase n=1 Tax=Heterodera trifolii TaxID=157864 RepID=A0ABD2HUU5_9BILA